MPRQQDFDEIREQAQFAAETGGTVHDADPAVILALFERFDANTTTADEGVEIVADLRTQLAITTAALRAACHDGWADGDSAMASYLLRGAIDADIEDRPATPADAEDDEALLEHGWRLRQDEPLPDGALEVIESLAAVGTDCGAGTAHAAALDDNDQAISTYGVLLDDALAVGVAVDCETGTLRWVTRPAGRS